MAWLACENVVRIELAPGLEVPGIPKTPFRIRSTEIYQRDDGVGNRRLEDVALPLLADRRRERPAGAFRRHLREPELRPWRG